MGHAAQLYISAHCQLYAHVGFASGWPTLQSNTAVAKYRLFIEWSTLVFDPDKNRAIWLLPSLHWELHLIPRNPGRYDLKCGKPRRYGIRHSKIDPINVCFTWPPNFVETLLFCTVYNDFNR